MRGFYSGVTRPCTLQHFPALYFPPDPDILQIAIDSAVFPQGTSGHQLDVLARKALWKDGLNYMVSQGASELHPFNMS